MSDYSTNAGSGMGSGTYGGSRTVTAMFDSSAEAERAVSRLRGAGVSDSSIRVTQGSSSYGESTYASEHKGFWDSLADFFFPDEDRYAYAEGLTRGAYMVTVTGFDAGMQETIIDILDDEGSVDLDARESEWRSSGWSDYRSSDYYDEDTYARTHRTGMSTGIGGAMAGAATAVSDALTPDSNTRGTVYDDGMQDRSLQMAADTGRRSQADLGSQQQGYASSGSMANMGGMGTDARDGDLTGQDTVKVVDERLAVGKRDVETGAVRVRSYVREEPVSADVELRATRVHIERRPVDRLAGEGDIMGGDRVIEAREHREEPVVDKEARVVEEIGLRQETDVRHETVQDTVRKTEVEIEDSRTGETTRLTGDTTRDGGTR